MSERRKSVQVMLRAEDRQRLRDLATRNGVSVYTLLNDEVPRYLARIDAARARGEVVVFQGTAPPSVRVNVYVEPTTFAALAETAARHGTRRTTLVFNAILAAIGR